MADRPNWKCYQSGKYLAACKHAEDAAILVAAWGSSGEVRWSHRFIVWREGKEEFSAGESFDRAAEVMHERLKQLQAEAYQRYSQQQSAAWNDIYNRPGNTRGE